MFLSVIHTTQGTPFRLHLKRSRGLEGVNIFNYPESVKITLNALFPYLWRVAQNWNLDLLCLLCNCILTTKQSTLSISFNFSISFNLSKGRTCQGKGQHQEGQSQLLQDQQRMTSFPPAWNRVLDNLKLGIGSRWTLQLLVGTNKTR